MINFASFSDELQKIAAEPIVADPINKEELVRHYQQLGRIGGGVGGAALGGGGLGLLGSRIAGITGAVIGGTVGALGGGYLGGKYVGRAAKGIAMGTPEDVFQARANLDHAEDLYERGELGDKDRLRATLIASNAARKAHGRKPLESDFLSRDRPGSYVVEGRDVAVNPYGISYADPYGYRPGPAQVTSRYRRVPMSE